MNKHPTVTYLLQVWYHMQKCNRTRIFCISVEHSPTTPPTPSIYLNYYAGNRRPGADPKQSLRESVYLHTYIARGITSLLLVSCYLHSVLRNEFWHLYNLWSESTSGRRYELTSRSVKPGVTRVFLWKHSKIRIVWNSETRRHLPINKTNSPTHL